MLEEALAKYKIKRGLDDVGVLTCMRNLANAYSYSRRLDKAAPLMEEVLARTKAKRGPDHLDTLIAMRELGLIVYLYNDRLDKALPLLEKVLAKNKDAAVAFTYEATLGMAYLYSGRLDKVLPLLEQPLAKAKAKFGADHRFTLMCMDTLGMTYLAAKRPAEAEPLFRDCLAHRANKLPDDWRTFLTQTLLGGALLAQKKYKEAEPLLLKGYEGMKARQTRMLLLMERRHMPQTLQWLVQLHEETGRPDQAAVWRKRLDEMKK